MSGIVFYKTQSFESVCSYYNDKIGMSLWLDQGNCKIYQSGNLLLGFIKSEETENQGIITFFFKQKREVDNFYKLLKDKAQSTPVINEKYNIYHFFTQDPEGRKVEFQTFLHNLESFETAEEALIKRRSIRSFLKDDISDSLLKKVFESCRFSPTSRNTESYYYIVIRDREKIAWLSEIREKATRPLKAAPVNILVCAAASKTKRVVQDACIAGVYLMISAHTNGLGTCWITDMDRTEIKKEFSIPEDDYIACATPIGFPFEEEIIPERRKIDEFIYFEKKE